MPSNYTVKETEQMVQLYTSNPCMETVEKLMTLLNRPKKSIISKLVKEGVYVSRRYLSKTGELPVTKLEIVREIENALDTTFPGLDKAPKSTLKELCDSILEQTTLFEEALNNVQELSEVNKVRKTMLGTKKHDKHIFDILLDD